MILDKISEEEKEGLHPSFFQCLSVLVLPFTLFLLLPFGARLFFVGIFFFYLEICFWVFIRFYITTIHYVAWPDRIEKRTGIFERRSKSIPFDQITEISCKQTIYQKIFKIGDIFIETASGKEFQICWAGVKYHEQVAKTLFAMKKGAGK